MGNIDNKVGHLAFPAKTPILLYACSKQSHMDLKDWQLDCLENFAKHHVYSIKVIKTI